MFATELQRSCTNNCRSARSLQSRGEVSPRVWVSTVEVVGQRGRRRFQGIRDGHQRPRAAPLSTVAAPLEVEERPRHSENELPKSWDASELDDSAIERELRKLRVNEATPAHKLRNQPVLVHRIRSRALRRKRSHLRRSSEAQSTDSLPLGVRAGERLSLEQQENLCSVFREWHRVQEVQVQVRNSSEGSQNPSSSWSEAAGLSQEELDRVLKDGPQAARALLTFAEFLLARFARNCLQGGALLEDVMAEARQLWLQAALQCDFSRSGLVTFGTLYVKQRLFRLVDEQQSLLQTPALTIKNTAIVKKMESALVDELGRRPTEKEIAERVNMPTVTVANLLKSYATTLSLDAPSPTNDSSETDNTLGETLPSNESSSGVDPNYAEAVQSELEARMRGVVYSVTDDIDKRMLLMRYGYYNNIFHSLKEISEEFNMSKEAVRKRLEKALFRLRKDTGLRSELQAYFDDGSLAEKRSA